MFRANLSFCQLNAYLLFMLKANLIGRFDYGEKHVYAPTEKGLDFLQRYFELKEMLRDDDETHLELFRKAKTAPSLKLHAKGF